MAYKWTVETEVHDQAGHPREWRVRLYEVSDAAAASEWSIGEGGEDHGDPCPFEVCRLASYRSTVVNGAGTTTSPSMGKVTSWVPTSLDHIWTNGAPSALVEVQPGTVIRLKDGSGRIIYGKSGVDVGVDNVINTEIIFVEGA